MDDFISLLTSIISLIATILGLYGTMLALNNRKEIQRQKQEMSDQKTELNKATKSISRVEKDISLLSTDVVYQGVEPAKFLQSNSPAIVNNNIRISMDNPALGNIAGSTVSWQTEKLRLWREHPDFPGANANGYFMNLKILGLRGEPYLEIRPIKADFNSWWEQTLFREASKPEEKTYVFKVYIDPNNRGFHLFRLWDKMASGKKYPVCTWVFDE